MITIIKNILKGVAFGITGTIPAVSGGAIALILGFYYELIDSLNNFTKNLKKYFKFLLPLLLGIVSGLLLFSSIMHYLLSNFSFPTMMFFIGLITGTVPIIYLRIHKNPITGKKIFSFSFKEIFCILIPFFTLFIIPNLNLASDIDPAVFIKNIDYPFMLFICFVGIVSGTSVVVPGISGVLFQLLMGVYPLIMYSVASIWDFLFDIKNTALLFDIIKVLIPMTVGILIGCFFMAKLIEKLLKNHNRKIFCVILGLLLGSIYVLFREPIVYQSGVSALIIITGIASFILGGMFSFFIGRYNEKTEKAAINF